MKCAIREFIERCRRVTDSDKATLPAVLSSHQILDSFNNRDKTEANPAPSPSTGKKVNRQREILHALGYRSTKLGFLPLGSRTDSQTSSKDADTKAKLLRNKVCNL